MKKIKKIIALVLAGVILFGGTVFATDPTDSFKVYTEVAGRSLIKVVAFDSTFTAPTTYQEFTSLTVDELSVKVTTSESPVDVKKLAYFSNRKFIVTMKVAPMTGTETNTYKINYSATCGGTAYTNPTTEQSSTVEVIKVDTIDTVTIGAKTVSVTVNKVDFNNAPTDTYTGTITFATTAP